MNDSPPSIVVVDDDDDTVTFLCDFFTMLGMAPVSCPVGLDVVANIRQHRPRAIILDVLLDGAMTGVDVLHQLRADPAMAGVPVIFFSGSQDTLRQLLPDYPAHGATFVPKPDIVKLQAAVQDLLQQST